MTDDSFETLRLPIEPLEPRAEAVADLRARLHRRSGLGPPPGTTPMAKAEGLQYEIAGPADGEPVLLMHAGTATSFVPLMTHPALGRYRLVRYHRRGYAGSDRFDGDMSVGAHVSDALRLLEYLGIESAHIVGHSGSGVIALQLALDAPEAVRSLVLEEPAIGHAIEPRWREVMLDAVAPAIEAHRSGDSPRAMERWMRGISLDWRVELTRTLPGGPQQTIEDAAAFMADVDAVFDWSLDRARVASLDVPVLYVLGAKSWPPRRGQMRLFAELVPHAETAVIDDATHMLHTDQPDQFGDEIAAFFARQRSGRHESDTRRERMRNVAGLTYEVHGEGEPVLLIHGSHIADGLVPLTGEDVLASRYQLIVYHRRGFAGSDRATPPFTIHDQAEDAARLLEELGVTRAHVVGHSYGAVTAIQLAASYPDVVHSLSLLEPPLRTPQDSAANVKQFDPLIEAYSSGDGAVAVDMFMQFVGGPDWREAVAKAVPGGPEQAEADAATFFEVELPALGEWDLSSIPTGSLSQPALYVIGSESGEPFESAIGLARSLAPKLEEARLPGLNHLLQMCDPTLVAEAIARFLEQHPLEFTALDGADGDA